MRGFQARIGAVAKAKKKKADTGQSGKAVAKIPQKRKKHKRGGRKHDWAKLKGEYIRATREDGHEVTLESFSLSKGVSPAALRMVAGKQNWRNQRLQYWDRVYALQKEKAVEKMAEQAAKQDAKDFKVSTGLIGLAGRNVETLDSAGKGARPSDLDRMASAVERSQRVHRIASGRPIPSNGGSQQVNVNVVQGGKDPTENLRRRFEACRMAGMDVDDVVRDYCQFVVDDILGLGITVRFERLKRLKE